MKRPRLFCVLLAAMGVLVAFPSGCAKPPSGPGQITIGLVVPSLTHPFFIYLQKSAEEEAAELGVRVIAADAGDVAAKQMSIVEDFIAQRVDGVLLSPIGADALVPAVEALNQAKIPVATVDRKVSGGDVLVHVGADNVEGGRVAARYVVEKLGGKGGVIELEGTPGASPAIDRKKGFDEVVAASRVRLLASQNADFDRAKGQKVMENLLQVEKDFQAVAYVICGLTAGASALVLTSRLNAAESKAGLGDELDVIASVVIGGTSLTGGRGSVWGTLLGALLIGMINNGMNLMKISAHYQLVVKGAIIVAAVLVDRFWGE